MSFGIVIISGIGLLALGLILIMVSLFFPRQDPISRRLIEYVEESEIQPSNRIAISSVRRDELSGSFSSRIFLPAFRKMSRLVGSLTPNSSLEDLSRKLGIAGNPLGMGAREFYGLRLILLVGALLLAFIFLRRGFNILNVSLAVMIMVLVTYLPRTWLRRMVQTRQNKIRKGLPDALDMLSVCAEAGLGFDQSLLRVSEHWKTPLGVEFGRVVREMEMGMSRREALTHMVDRLDVAELSSFVAVILQSDQLGMSISDTLQSQAKQMREERRFRAQEQARKMPLKMLMPMVFFIFPAILIVILGPLIPMVSQIFGNMAVRGR